PSATLNHRDDFGMYLPRVARMLQTGSLAGNPFDGTGYDTLGGQAFMQALLVAHLPLDYAWAFDGLLCLALSLVVLAELADEWEVNCQHALLPMLLLLAIDPQIINLSTVYAGALLIVGLLLAGTRVVRALSGVGPWDRAFGPSIALGLLMAALLTLKSSLV